MSVLIIPDIAAKGRASSTGRYMRWESILGIAAVVVIAKGMRPAIAKTNRPLPISGGSIPGSEMSIHS